MKLILGLAALAASAGVASAAVTVSQWDLNGAAGDQAFTAGSGVANVTADNLTRGAGLTANTGGNSLNSAGWTQQATDYVSLGMTVAGGFGVDLKEFYFGARSSNSGPGLMGLYYSGDGFASPIASFVMPSGSVFINQVVDLSALPVLTGNVEFRFAQIGNVAANGGSTSASGTWRITAYFVGGVFDRNLQFTGDVVPTPGTIALLGLGGLMAGRRRR
ncbi:MAG: PEP-CTERM sorting domain-containing protein [Phycisphaerae bacterium]|nr:PEP-CTERM sorting domain-containing protein [Phycisphaerae bacterium]